MDINLNIEKGDIDFLRKFLLDKTVPQDLEEITYQVALFKTREKRTDKVKVYNPNCEFKVSDLIYKEYPGKIPIGSKKYIELEKGVVLRVTEIKERYGKFELHLSYEGTSNFRKYIDYLERQKIELLLPHKQQRPYDPPEYLTEDIDPRLHQAPLLDRDFNLLKKKLISALNKETAIAFISNKVLLSKHLKTIDAGVFDHIREFMKENKQSVTTEFLVENFVRIDPKSEDFPSYCFALNYAMKTEYKIDFQQTNDTDWGKWNLISVIYYMQKNSIMSEANPLEDKVLFDDRTNLVQKRRKFEEELFAEEINKYFLTQREVTAGAVKLKPGFYDLGESIEVEVIDEKLKKAQLVYYFRDANLMIGFKDVFEKYKAIQGTIISFEKTEDGKLTFNIRTTKKGTVVDKIEYDEGNKAFKPLDEKIASQVFVHKVIFLESPMLKEIYDNIREYRSISTFNGLIHKIFLNFGVKERNYEIHVLKLYHILDLIFPVNLKLVEDTLLSNPEFVPDEKFVGLFYLDSDVVSDIENQEVKRKEMAALEPKKKRPENRKKKRPEADEGTTVDDEIKRKREERRKKREQEMWLKEKLELERKEREVKRLLEVKNLKEAGAAGQAMAASADGLEDEEPGRPSREDREYPEDSAEKTAHEPAAAFTGAPEAGAPAPAGPSAEEGAKLARAKKVKKFSDEEKDKTAVKGAKRPKPAVEEELSVEEIKSEIQLEELKAKIAERKTRADADKAKKPGKEKKVAYHDKGDFGGVLASKLDNIVKKDSSKEEKSGGEQKEKE